VTRFYINTNKTLVSNGQIKIRVGETTPDPNIDPFASSVVTYQRFDGANGSQSLTDSAPSPKTTTVLGSTAISTVTKKYGTGSITNFSNGGVSIANGIPTNIGADFTIEMWVNPTSYTDMFLWAVQTDGGGWWRAQGFPAWQTTWVWDAGNVTFARPALGEWTHLAFVRQGNILRVYSNGTQLATAAAPSYYDNSVYLRSTTMYVGHNGAGVNFDGYIDDFRVTDACRYPDGTTFIPPSDTSPTTTTTTTTTTSAPTLSGYNIGSITRGDDDYAGNYTISGTSPGNTFPSWQHATKNYILEYQGGGTGWLLFPGTIEGGISGSPIAFQSCGFPGGGSGTCTDEIITGTYATSDGLGTLFTVTDLATPTTTTAAPTTTTTTTTAAPQALTFSALATGCGPRWQLGNIPANTASLRLTASGSHRGGTFSNVMFIIPIDTNSGTNAHKITGPTNNSYNLTIEHYGASLPSPSAPGASAPGYFRTITRNDIYSYNMEHTFTANIEALDASNNVIGIINNTSWIKDDCDD